MPRCPQCGSEDLRCEERETREPGYHDISHVWICGGCGALSTEKEMEAENGKPV